MNQIHEKMIQAVIQKAEQVCPGALALIGVYGSVATGDVHKRSDLDLLILIEDERGRALATGMILEDVGIGYDLYCTTWESLRRDAEIYHAHVAKLMDCKVVYVGKEGAYEELCRLREQAAEVLQTEARFERAGMLMDRAKALFADVCLSESLGDARVFACYLIDDLAGALMLHNGRYFRLGTKRMLEELAALPGTDVWIESVKGIALARDLHTLQRRCRESLRIAQSLMQPNAEKRAPSAALAGTYEEMYSNWRNKMVSAAESQDVFSSFANLCGLHGMLAEISREYSIASYDVMGAYDPDRLSQNAELFDRCLQAYESEYQKAGISVKRYADVDAFVAEYMQN